MMSPRKMPQRSIGLKWIGWLVTVTAVTFAPAAQATALDLFYERTVMSVADHRCNLFAPPVTVALMQHACKRGARPCAQASIRT